MYKSSAEDDRADSFEQLVKGLTLCKAKSWFSNYILIYLSGLTPSDSFDEAQADMIVDGVEDLRVAMVKAHFQKDEEEKVRFHS